ncbi:hypothetical protein Y032_0229g2916 [Ancylostoma ceylanicum]|uniref:Uncharacterized protein n=1 Tax=Ancylostoma ceylanicum TaxID=53326 RepID=A0A016SG22_9BILA|nr:hypothetical protein Y032_0229g2916 [Ancylostoma ceylanicum]
MGSKHVPHTFPHSVPPSARSQLILKLASIVHIYTTMVKTLKILMNRKRVSNYRCGGDKGFGWKSSGDGGLGWPAHNSDQLYSIGSEG